MPPSTSTSNGKKLTYKPTKGSGDLRPGLPAGQWIDSEIAPASNFPGTLVLPVASVCRRQQRKQPVTGKPSS